MAKANSALFDEDKEMAHRPGAIRLSLLCLTLLCLTLLAPALLQAQTPKKSKTRTAESDPLAEARRTTAIMLVNSLADEARNFSGPVLRARTQARAADALWETDKERARTLFVRAWEAAEAADKELGEQRAREASRRGAPSSREAGSVRREVLRLAAKRDRALGEGFLKRLDEASKQETADASSAATTSGGAQTPRINPDDPPTTMTQRLNLARQLLEDGDTERAMLFADPALYPVNTFGMNVLDMLRERDMKAADARYMTLLARAATDPASDANTVSLLSTYALTPFLYITVRPDGNSHTRRFRSNNALPENFDPRIRDSFLRAAAQILLRPLAPADQDASSSGRIGAYVVATRLAPIFERYLPDIAPQIRARQSALMQETPERNRRPDDPLLTRGLVPEPSRDERLQDALSRLERTTNPDERDMIHFQIAMGFVEDDLARAREYASKIEDADMRGQLMAALAFAATEAALRGRKPEEAFRLAHADELPPIQRIYALTETARLLSKDQPGRAVEILNEALTEAKKLDAGTKERAQALTAVATGLYGVDKPRAWDLMSEVVRAANAANDFTGEDGGIVVIVRFKRGGAMTRGNDVESFDLRGIFSALAKEDVDRAVEVARGLKGEAARSVAMLSISQAVLAQPRAGANSQQVQQTETRQ